METATIISKAASSIRLGRRRIASNQRTRRTRGGGCSLSHRHHRSHKPRAPCLCSDRRKSPTKFWSPHSTILLNSGCVNAAANCSMILLLGRVVGEANATAVANPV
ncbi:uncharacterized protein DS421_11g333620 [Arachis hypogaea]|nr:uncharacterized protein DS421_11g333620 [Arachis hypogaea]